MWRDEGYLLDILNEARKLVHRFQGVSRADFDRDEQRQYVAFWSIAVIGEAANKISGEFRDSHPGLPWREMVAMRNILVHDYARIDLDVVWGVITHSAPALIQAIGPLLPGENA